MVGVAPFGAFDQFALGYFFMSVWFKHQHFESQNDMVESKGRVPLISEDRTGQLASSGVNERVGEQPGLVAEGAVTRAPAEDQRSPAGVPRREKQFECDDVVYIRARQRAHLNDDFMEDRIRLRRAGLAVAHSLLTDCPLVRGLGLSKLGLSGDHTGRKVLIYLYC